MKTTPFYALIGATMLLILAGCSKEEEADDLPSKSTIRSIIPKEAGIHRLLLGRQVVHSGRDDFDNRRISENEFKEVVAWNRVGLIRLQSEDILGDNSQFTWEDWMKRTSGQLKRINVELTEKGRELDAKTAPEERLGGWAYGRFYSEEVDEIVSRELHAKAGSNYCVVHAILRNELTDIGEKVYRAMGNNRGRTLRIKVIWLLKHDPFEKAWKWIATDGALEGEEIKSNNVNQALLNAK